MTQLKLGINYILQFLPLPIQLCLMFWEASWVIKLACLCNVDPRKPCFYVVKLGLKGYTFFVIFALKHRLWVQLESPR